MGAFACFGSCGTFGSCGLRFGVTLASMCTASCVAGLLAGLTAQRYSLRFVLVAFINHSFYNKNERRAPKKHSLVRYFDAYDRERHV